MAIRYKTTTLSGKPILSHRKVWITAHGPIPHGYHVHHKNGDKFDNRLENLELVHKADHCALHGRGRVAWNRGTAYGQTEAYAKSHASRKDNYYALCRTTYELYREGRTQGAVAEILGVCRRQVSDRLRSFREHNHIRD